MEIGEIIRGFRQKQGITLNTLSNKSGVSKSLLSMVERNKSTPTVRTLDKIAAALGLKVTNLYNEVENDRIDKDLAGSVTVVHRKDKKRLILDSERGEAHYELLTPDYRRKLQIIYIHFPVGKKRGKFIRHEGEECGIILEGRLKALIGDQKYILEEGDSIYFDSNLPHCWENIGDIEVRAFWVNTPPTF